MSRQRFRQIVTLVSIVSFFGSTAYGAIGAINSAIKQPQEKSATAATSTLQLRVQERGYELVLQREPDNQVALQGLVSARLQLKDVRGAILPLEKLVRLNPHQQEYRMLLARVKHQVGRG